MKAFYRVKYTLVHRTQDSLNTVGSVTVVADNYDARSAIAAAEKYVLQEKGNGVFDFTLDGVEKVDTIDVIAR